MEEVKMSEITSIPNGTATPTFHNRPRPIFYDNNGVLTSKKENAGHVPRISSEPRRMMPLKGTVTKSCLKRFHAPPSGPNMVSWTSAYPKDLSSLYDPNLQQSYFQQIYTRNQTKKGVETGEPGLMGSGSFSCVYSVTSKDDGRKYAVKWLDTMITDRDIKRKNRELKSHQQLPPHPNCVKIYSAWEEHSHLYMQIELCRTSLEEYAKDTIIPEYTLWEFLIDVLRAVHHVHSLGYIHMDIKPANILISDNGLLKLADFGLMIESNKLDESDKEDGDATYLAPEVYNDIFSQSADIFSLGITMFELATDSDLAATRNHDPYHQLRENNFPEGIFKEHNISTDMEEIIRWMMRKEPRERPTAEQLLDHPRVKYTAWKLALKRAIRQMFHPYINYILSAFSNILPPRFKAAIGYGSEGDSQLDVTSSYTDRSLSPKLDDTHRSSGVVLEDSTDCSFESPQLPMRARQHAMTTGNIKRLRVQLFGLDESPTQSDNSSVFSPKLNSRQESQSKRKTNQNSDVTPPSARKRINFDGDDEMDGALVEKPISSIQRNLMSMFDDSDED